MAADKNVEECEHEFTSRPGNRSKQQYSNQKEFN